jgi:mycofactocin precursor
MSERAATVTMVEETPQPEAAEPELAEADLLVEEVSIDGLCGVY